MLKRGILPLTRWKSPTLLGGVHGLARLYLEKRGFQWEERRSGEIGIGYWRKILKPKDQKRAYPKRFVMVPGFGDTPLSWHLVLSLVSPILKQNFDEVILVDFPGFGGFLAQQKTFPTLDLMLSSVNDTLDYLKPHTIMGHSLGGFLAAHYAASCGSGVRPLANKLNYSGPESLVLANPTGIFPDEATRQHCASIFRQSSIQGFSILRPHLFAKEPAWFGLIVPYFSAFITREDTMQFMSSIRDDYAPTDAIQQIKSKVWLVWGEQDTLIPKSCAFAWLKHLNADRKENHHVVLLRKIGHSPHLEKPAVTAAVLGQILSNRKPHSLGERWWTLA